jgi:hypothetical protein
VVVDDLERLTPDRAGGAQERDSLHPGKCRFAGCGDREANRVWSSQPGLARGP